MLIVISNGKHWGKENYNKRNKKQIKWYIRKCDTKESGKDDYLLKICDGGTKKI